MISNRFRRLILFPVPVLSALALCAAHASQADDSSASAVVDSGDASQCKQLPSRGTKPLPGGGTDYLFELDGGTVEIPVPPAGWTPLTATAQELASYGIPERPTTEAALAAWTDDWADYARPSTPGICVSKSTYATLTSTNEPNWAGYVAEPSPGNRYHAISGEFDQPARLTTSCSAAQQVLWVGLGGYPRADGSWGLIQMGTRSRPAGSPDLWWEYVGQDAQGNPTGIPLVEVTGIAIQRGDHVKLSLDYDTNGDRTVFTWRNETDNTTLVVIKTIAQGTYYDGRFGDWIIERPFVGGSYTPLQNFGNVNWTYAKVQNQLNHWNYIAETEDQRRVAMRESGITFATTGSLSGPSGGTFTSDWNRC